VQYTQPAKHRNYTPDIRIGNLYIEVKGEFTVEDRQKHINIRNSNPKLDIRFVFGNPNSKISPSSQTRYRDWCDRNGFLWAARKIPKDWVDEAIGNQRRKTL